MLAIVWLTGVEHAARSMLTDDTQCTWPLCSTPLCWPHHANAALPGTAAAATLTMQCGFVQELVSAWYQHRW